MKLKTKNKLIRKIKKININIGMEIMQLYIQKILKVDLLLLVLL